jgi:hypothetical protein
MPGRMKADPEQGMAVLIALIGLCILSMISLFMSLTAAVEVRISDNFESEIQAGSAARAGINHTRELLRGLDFSDLLEGPDGTHDPGAAYLAQAREFGFRNPLSWRLARSLDLSDPAPNLVLLPDDGIINTGLCAGVPGIILIPLTGVSPADQGPDGGRARYFVKVSDNNGEPSELAEDPQDSPFFDGDGTVIVRSMGLSRTLAESGSST